jgi:dihydrofolate reductase
MIRIIAAMSTNRVIGSNNALPWHIPNDLKHFKELTTGHTIVMGRKTFDSIGRPLPNRRNIVVTRDHEFKAEGVEVASSFEKAMEMSFWNCFVIGGGEMYRQSMGIAEKLYLTIVNTETEGDTTFPEFGDEWVKVWDMPKDADDKNPFQHTFFEYEKCKF